ncbi:hypothetical protein [Azospirillum sp. INR13]|uniref:hypothetical protein n=1 Tax=Azospirillum sp. INR13 TaxID=2596919 RepID=UPI0021030F12|nr:hypothetical protein [Azospirillum sp. INR13]
MPTTSRSNTTLPIARRRLLAGAAVLGAAVLGAAALGAAAAGAAMALPLPAFAATTLRVGYIPIIPMTQLYVLTGEGWRRMPGWPCRPPASSRVRR